MDEQVKGKKKAKKSMAIALESAKPEEPIKPAEPVKVAEPVKAPEVPAPQIIREIHTIREVPHLIHLVRGVGRRRRRVRRHKK